MSFILKICMMDVAIEDEDILLMVAKILQENVLGSRWHDPRIH